MTTNDLEALREQNRVMREALEKAYKCLLGDASEQSYTIRLCEAAIAQASKPEAPAQDPCPECWQRDIEMLWDSSADEEEIESIRARMAEAKKTCPTCSGAEAERDVLFEEAKKYTIFNSLKSLESRVQGFARLKHITRDRAEKLMAAVRGGGGSMSVKNTRRILYLMVAILSVAAYSGGMLGVGCVWVGACCAELDGYLQARDEK